MLALLYGAARFFIKEDVFVGIFFFGRRLLLWMAFSMMRVFPDLHMGIGVSKKIESWWQQVFCSAADPY